MARRERRKPNSSKMDMTPLIDVVFQLIVFFILTMTIVVEDIKNVTLPTALTAVKEDPTETVYLVHFFNAMLREGNVAPGADVTDHWGIWLPKQNERFTKAEEISDMLQKACVQYGLGTEEVKGMDLEKLEVLVRGDMRCPSHYFGILLEACIKAKIWKVKVSIAPNPEDLR